MTPRSFRPDSGVGLALVIGAMKSGTTTLFDLLAQHPGVAACEVKEPDFFADETDPVGNWARYGDLFQIDPDRHVVALEASVAYTKAPWVPDVPRRIHEVPGLDVRFIYILRHPLRRIESQVRHALFEGWGQSLDDAPVPRDAVDFSRYASQLEEYLRHFDRDRFLLLTLEQLQRDPAEVLERCCAFLGLSPDFPFESIHEKRNSGEFYGTPGAVKAVSRNPILLRVARALLSRRQQQRLRDFVARRFRSTAEPPRTRLSEEEAAAVIGELTPDLLALRDRFGIDVAREWDLALEEP